MVDRRDSTSDSSDSSESERDESTSDEESSDDENKSFKRKKGKCKSGLFTKASNARVLKTEMHAHSALDPEMGDRDLKELTFNLLVAGELEIILDPRVKRKERDTRLELLRQLAYKHEYMSRAEVMNQYKGFMSKIEKGRYKWGSRRDLRDFEHHLILIISIENRKFEKGMGQDRKQKKLDDRVKYCLDFNRGLCKLEKQHEGKINGQTVTKHHICRRCLVEDNREVAHAEKDCTKAK